jgi:hypothetical protein
VGGDEKKLGAAGDWKVCVFDRFQAENSVFPRFSTILCEKMGRNGPFLSYFVPLFNFWPDF